MSIHILNVSKAFGPVRVLDDVSLVIPTGELVALLGPSGSGKTTLLRIVAGLEYADRGRIVLEGQEAAEGTSRKPGVGFVFQHYALFRHMTVLENVAFGLRVRPRSLRPPESEIRRNVHDLLSLVQLDGFADRLPDQLSGGQRQRVALARALAVEPKVLLLDEPFGSLDARVRKELRRWLRRLHDDLHITSLLVTHDQDEALEVADRVAVIHEGRVQQVGTPAEVYHHPANAFVYRFLGDVNLFQGRVIDGKVRLGNLALDLPDRPSNGGASAAVYVRPYQLTVHPRPQGELCFKAEVMRINVAGSTVKLGLRSEWGAPVEVELSPERFRDLELAVGVAVFVSFSKEEAIVEH
jgi:sulfate transport system ATP-binding protein